jgi:hypothetical protein
VAIGVTGHRQFVDTSSIRMDIDRALIEACERFGATSIVLYSALAEGADRLVAERALLHDAARLVAVLPFERNEYMKDFISHESRNEFRRLLDRARSIVELEITEGRDAGYTAAGDYILECSDVLIALWDGKEGAGEGGTASIVKAARGLGVPLIWLRVSRTSE